MAKKQWQIIAKREFLERVRTKWFVIVTLLGPIAMIGILVVPAYLSAKSDEKTVSIEIVDETGSGLGDLVGPLASLSSSRFKFVSAPEEATKESLLKRVASSEIDGFIVIGKNALGPPASPSDPQIEDDPESRQVVYRGNNASSFSLGQTLEIIVNTAAVTLRMQGRGISPEESAELLSRVSVEMLHPEGSSGSGSFIAGYIVMFLLYMSILLYAINVMRSVILEKSSRIVEIIISAVKPRSLMLGKIIGVGSVGLAQLTAWALIALLLINFRGPILGVFGIDGSSSFGLPELSAADITLILVYFLLGYFLYSAMYAAIGALVSSEQEATQLQMPVVLLLVLPVMCVQIVSNDPRGGISSALTLFPFSSPVLMPMRVILDGATPMEIALSIAILIGTTMGVVWLAARIYRVGILLTGKRPSVSTIWRWIRHG